MGCYVRGKAPKKSKGGKGNGRTCPHPKRKNRELSKKQRRKRYIKGSVSEVKRLGKSEREGKKKNSIKSIRWRTGEREVMGSNKPKSIGKGGLSDKD